MPFVYVKKIKIVVRWCSLGVEFFLLLFSIVTVMSTCINDVYVIVSSD